MSERYIESMQTEKSLRKMADDANKDLHNPVRSEIKDLNGKYNELMAEYEKALNSGNDFAADELLNQANAIVKKLNEIDPRMKGQEKTDIPSIEKLEEESITLMHKQQEEEKMN
jgi:hypothetical protein